MPIIQAAFEAEVSDEAIEAFEATDPALTAECFPDLVNACTKFTKIVIWDVKEVRLDG